MRSNTVRGLVMVASILFLAACSTEYGAMNYTGGVASVPVANDVYRISARGNGYTDATIIQDYALLKAAETTLDAGRTHFTVLTGTDATSSSMGQTAGTFQSFGTFATYNPGITYEIVKPGQDVMIRAWSPRPSEALPPMTFNAREVFDNINPRVKRAKS